jgi:hypothetical protein
LQLKPPLNELEVSKKSYKSLVFCNVRKKSKNTSILAAKSMLTGSIKATARLSLKRALDMGSANRNNSKLSPILTRAITKLMV